MISNCTFSDVTWFTPYLTLESMYTCLPKSELDPSTSNHSFNHRSGKSDNDVEAVCYRRVVMNSFPRNLSSVFKNLTSLTIQSCGLTSLSKEDLIGLGNLDTLCVENNQLQSLPDDLFVDMHNLRLIGFKSNQLRIMSSKLLLPVVRNHLVTVDFRDNVAVNAFYGRLPELVFNPGGHPWFSKIRLLMAHIDDNCEEQQDYDTEENHSLLAEFESMRQSEHLTDFVVSAGPESRDFPVHKTVLAAQSTVFADIFRRLATRHAIAADISIDAVADFLDYLYTRKIPNRVNMLASFKLAAKYEVNKLKSICERLLWENLDEGNALEIYTIGDDYNSEVLKILAFAEIKEMLGVRICNEFINEFLLNN